MATYSTSDHDICVKRDKCIVAFILHPMQHERWKRNLLRIIALLRPAPIVHVSSVVFVFIFAFCLKEVSLTFLCSFTSFLFPQDVAHIHLLVYLGTSMQSVVLRQNVAEINLVPGTKSFLKLCHHNHNYDHHHDNHQKQHGTHPTFHA